MEAKEIKKAENYLNNFLGFVKNTLISYDEVVKAMSRYSKNQSINYKCCHCKLKDKKITDLLNWVKSDLAQETNIKLGKTATPYRTEKIRFLNRILKI
jgi:hypothetical protein